MKLTDMTLEDLRTLLAEVKAEIARRTTLDAPPIAYSLRLYGGNKRAGAKTWAKVVTGIDPSKGNGYDILGDWVGLEGAAKPGTYILVGGRGGSWKNVTRSYALLQVKAEGDFYHESGYQIFEGTGVQLVASSDDQVDKQAVLNKYPDLAPVAGSDLLPIYVALKEAGF